MNPDFDLAGWARDGFFVERSVLPPAVLEELRAEVDRLVATLSADWERASKERVQTEGEDKKDFEYVEGLDNDFDHQIRLIEPLVDISPVFRRLADDERITHPAQAVFGDGVSLFEDKLTLKLPGGSGFPWHQDWACCWRAHTDDLVTCFVYLDDSTEMNGCLQVVPCSHAGKHIRPFRPGSEFAVEITEADRADAIPLPLQAGDMIAFDPYLLHYSAPNRTDRSRRAIIYTYNPARLGDLWPGHYPDLASPKVDSP